MAGTLEDLNRQFAERYGHPVEESEEYRRAVLRAHLGQSLKQVRVNARLTQSELADLLGVSQPRIARIESGVTNVGSDTLLAWVRATGGEVRISQSGIEVAEQGADELDVADASLGLSRAAKDQLMAWVTATGGEVRISRSGIEVAKQTGEELDVADANLGLSDIGKGAFDDAAALQQEVSEYILRLRERLSGLRESVERDKADIVARESRLELAVAALGADDSVAVDNIRKAIVSVSGEREEADWLPSKAE